MMPRTTQSHPPARRRRFAVGLVGFLALALLPTFARAADPEGCLTCHQYRGLARVKDDGKSLSLSYVNPNYYSQALGPHARLRCTDCHVRTEVGVYPHQKLTPVDVDETWPRWIVEGNAPASWFRPR